MVRVRVMLASCWFLWARWPVDIAGGLLKSEDTPMGVFAFQRSLLPLLNF